VYNKYRTTIDNFVFNHFEVNENICTKSGLIESLKTYYEQFHIRQHNYNIFDSTPTSFIINNSIFDKNYKTFLKR